MFVAFPISTDAPIYHFPYATIGLIAVNTVVFLLTATMDPDLVKPWMIVYGESLHPLQWVTSLFLHDGFGHLLGNMVFLWTFGLVVEGKLGWWRFLAVYLLIGVAESLIGQVAFLGLDKPEYGLGASGAISGLLAIALVWAPLNEVQIVGLFWFFIIRPFSFDLAVVWCAGGYIALDVLFAWLQGFQLSGELAHVIGAVMGGVLGVVLLNRNLVDCENWDVFAVLEGRKGKTREEAAAAPRKRQVDYEPPPDLPNTTAPLAEPGETKASLTKLREKLTALIQAEKTHAALAMWDRVAHLQPGFVLPEPQLLQLIELLHTERKWPESIPFLEQYLAHYTAREIPIRLRLAQVLIEHQQRPSYGLRVMEKLPASLGLKFAPLRDKLAAKARQLIDDGVLELEGQGW